MKVFQIDGMKGKAVVVKVIKQLLSLLNNFSGGKIKMPKYLKSPKRIGMTAGESLSILREFQELSQNELARLSGIPQSTISKIERDRINLDLERAKVLAKALHCHSAVLSFRD